MIIIDTLDELKVPHVLIKRIAIEKNLSASLLAAIVIVESSGDKYAVQYQPDYKHLLTPKYFAKKTGVTEATERVFQQTSFGYMQILGSTARELGFYGPMGKLFEPETNIRLGASYLARLRNLYVSETDWISAYNQGQPFRRANGDYCNQDYVERVLAAKLKASAWL